MQGTCKLCGQLSELEMSHFIPKFVGKWIKRTSITSYLRESDKVHKRVQDIAKEYWLCRECENLFSAWETKFANKIFYPFLDESEPVLKYGDWMSKFCASLSWRTLTYIRSKNNHEKEPLEYLEALDDAEIHLSSFLLGKKNNLSQYEQHLFPLERISSTTLRNMPSNINRYFLRTTAMDIIVGSPEKATSSKK